MMKLVRGVVLLAMAGLIVRLLATGQMALYLNSSVDPLSGLTAFVLAGLGLLELVGAGRELQRLSLLRAPAITDEVLTTLIILLPVALGLFASPHALDSTAVNDHDLARAVVTFSTVAPTGSVQPPAQPIQDLPDLFSYLREAGEGGVGQPVHVLGMVARSEALPVDQFVLLRYRIVHCVADAQPIGLLVEFPDASRWPTDSWVEIDGHLASHDAAGAHLVSVTASHVDEIDEPPNPYLAAL
jgi:uncharacterized repeat protein (TIGR03943 family)